MVWPDATGVKLGECDLTSLLHSKPQSTQCKIKIGNVIISPPSIVYLTVLVAHWAFSEFVLCPKEL